jgi:hypothetical protein
MIGVNVKINYAMANKKTRLLIINNLLLRAQIVCWRYTAE